MPQPPPPGPSKPTILHGGLSYEGKFGPPKRPASPERRRTIEETEALLAKFNKGDVPLDQMDVAYVEDMHFHQDETNANRFQNVAKRMFNRDKDAISMVRTLGDLYGWRAPGEPPLTANMIPRKTMESMQNQKAAVALRIREGQAFRELTGYGIGANVSGKVKLFSADGEVAAILNDEFAQNIVASEKFAPALLLIQDVEAGKDQKMIMAAADAALDAAGEGRSAGDGILFKKREDRLEAFRLSIGVIQSAAATPGQKAVARQTALSALLAEAQPNIQTLQLLMDMTPLLGNIRAVEDAAESFEAAKKALEADDWARFSAEAATTLLHVAGASGGVLAPLKGLAKAAGNTKYGKKVAAAHEIGKAQRLSEEKLPSYGITKIIDPADWAKLLKHEQNYLRGLFANVKGRVREEVFRERLAELGLKPLEKLKNKQGKQINPARIKVPGKRKYRVYDSVYKDKALLKFLSFAYVRNRPGLRIGAEFKADSSRHTKVQKEGDHKITTAAKEERDQASAATPAAEPQDMPKFADAPETPDMRGHNNPPSSIETDDVSRAGGDPVHASPASRDRDRPPNVPGKAVDPAEAELVDIAILMRLPSDNLDKRRLAEAFYAAAFSEKGKGIARLKEGDWTVERFHEIIDLVQRSLIDQARKDEPPVVGDLIAGVMARIAAEFKAEEEQDPGRPRNARQIENTAR